MAKFRRYLLMAASTFVLGTAVTIAATVKQQEPTVASEPEACALISQRTVSAIGLAASPPDCGKDRKVCSNAKGEYWCCNKGDICTDTPGGCKKGDGGRRPD